MAKIIGSFLKIIDDEEKINNLTEICDYIHADIMDGKFTEKSTKLKENLKKVFDVHLMVQDILTYVDKALIYNPKYITFHIEATDTPEKIINYIKSKGVKAGIALNPKTNIDSILPYLKDVDLVLIMSVQAGSGGQPFIDISEKLNWLINYREENNLSFITEVDGGITDETIKKVKQADVIVAGSYITNDQDYQAKLYKLKKSLRNGFTLAELLGVIVVISILSLVAITAIDSNIKNSRYETCLAQEKNLTEGAKMVTIDYPDLLPSSGSLTIPVTTMQDGGIINGQTIDGGYVEDNLINPMTETTYVSSNVSVKVTKDGSNYEYTVVYANTNEACHK